MGIRTYIQGDSGSDVSQGFDTVAVSGQTDIDASATPTLTLVAGTNVTITTNAGTGAATINSSGGSAAAGGSNTQLQYNNAGALGGITGATTNGTAVTLTAPVLGTPASGTMTNCTGLPIGTGVSGLGTGIATALAVNTGSAGAPVLFNGAGGTPSSVTLTNGTGLPVAGITSSTSTALGVGSLELGDASDTTLTRVSAGVLAVEGVTVPTISSTNTLTNKTINCDFNTVTNVARLKVDADNTLPATCAKGEVVVLDNGTFWSGQATNDWQQVLTASDIGGVRAVTGTTDTILSSDFTKLVTFTNAAAIAVTLPQAGSGSPAAWNNGWWFTAENIGLSAVTITPTTSTINGIATLVLLAGQSAVIYSNGTNYLASVAVSSKSVYYAALNVDDTYTGSTIVGLNAGATIAQWEPVYIGGSSTWLLADANGSGTYPARGLATAAYVDTNPAVILTQGTVRNDAWNWTIGGTIYLSGTAGTLTQTAPSTSGDKVQAVGYALTADIAYFDFNSTYLTVT